MDNYRNYGKITGKNEQTVQYVGNSDWAATLWPTPNLVKCVFLLPYDFHLLPANQAVLELCGLKCLFQKLLAAPVEQKLSFTSQAAMNINIDYLKPSTKYISVRFSTRTLYIMM